MAWWNWDYWRNRIFTARDRDSPLYWGAETWAGESVTVHGAMQLSAFWACVRLISQTIATLPLGVYERREDGEKVPRPDHPLYRLLHDSPSADQTAVEFWEGRVLGLCTSGNGYAEKKLSSSGRLISLERMPADTYVRRLETGVLEYRYSYYGKEIVLPEERVFHIRAFGDDYCGMSPVSYARQTLGVALATERASANIFAKGLRTKGFFTAPQLLNPEQRAQAKKVLIDPYSGPNGAEWGILEAGFDFKTVNITARDAELILSRNFNVEDVCRWLGVPPILVGHAAQGQTMWGSGVEQIMLGWLTLGLRPYLNRIEQRIRKSLLTPADIAAGIFAEFNADGLLRGDSAARGELYSKLANVGAITPNGVCDKENFPRFKGGDVHFINSTLVPIDMAGQKSANPAQPPPPNAPSNVVEMKPRRMKIVDVTKRSPEGHILQTVTREIEEA